MSNRELRRLRRATAELAAALADLPRSNSLAQGGGIIVRHEHYGVPGYQGLSPQPQQYNAFGVPTPALNPQYYGAGGRGWST